MKHVLSNAMTALVLSLAVPQGALAEDTMKLAVGQKGSWPTSMAEAGQRAGIFEKHGLVLDITYTSGGGETMQPLISGAVDVGVGMAAAQVMAAYAKGAPVRIIGSSTTGVMDLMWFVKADSPIKKLADAAGHTFAFSSTGTSTDIVGRALLDQYKVNAQMVAMGSFAATMTATMSGQVDVGWSAPPLNFKPLNNGEIRVIATGNDATNYKDQSARVVAANSTSLSDKPDQFKRFVDGYRETVAWAYSDDPAALATMAALMGQSEDIVRQTRDVYVKESLEFDRKTGIDAIVADAVKYKFMEAPLSADQLKELYPEIGR